MPTVFRPRLGLMRNKSEIFKNDLTLPKENCLEYYFDRVQSFCKCHNTSHCFPRFVFTKLINSILNRGVAKGGVGDMTPPVS